jgi:hypothetical protein
VSKHHQIYESDCIEFSKATFSKHTFINEQDMTDLEEKIRQRRKEKKAMASSIYKNRQKIGIAQEQLRHSFQGQDDSIEVYDRVICIVGNEDGYLQFWDLTYLTKQGTPKR